MYTDFTSFCVRKINILWKHEDNNDVEQIFAPNCSITQLYLHQINDNLKSKRCSHFFEHKVLEFLEDVAINIVQNVRYLHDEVSALYIFPKREGWYWRTDTMTTTTNYPLSREYLKRTTQENSSREHLKRKCFKNTNHTVEHSFNLSSLWKHGTNGPSCNKYLNFGFIFNEIEGTSAEYERFVVFIESEAQ